MLPKSPTPFRTQSPTPIALRALYALCTLSLCATAHAGVPDPHDGAPATDSLRSAPAPLFRRNYAPEPKDNALGVAPMIGPGRDGDLKAGALAFYRF